MTNVALSPPFTLRVEEEKRNCAPAATSTVPVNDWNCLVALEAIETFPVITFVLLPSPEVNKPLRVLDKNDELMVTIAPGAVKMLFPTKMEFPPPSAAIPNVALLLKEIPALPSAEPFAIVNVPPLMIVPPL